MTISDLGIIAKVGSRIGHFKCNNQSINKMSERNSSRLPLTNENLSNAQIPIRSTWRNRPPT